MEYEIECWEDAGERYVAIVGEVDLDNHVQMAAVTKAVRKEFGTGFETSGEGSEHTDSNGKIIGWCWSVEEAA
jgi:hypothetical protein